ncbi:hypothetical protein D3C75_1346940 [compost metagenome]
MLDNILPVLLEAPAVAVISSRIRTNPSPLPFALEWLQSPAPVARSPVQNYELLLLSLFLVEQVAF